MGSADAEGVPLHAADWAHTFVEGERAGAPCALVAGAVWAWRGPLLRLDSPAGPLRLEGAAGRADLQRMAAGRMARMMRRRTGPGYVDVLALGDPGDTARSGLLRGGFRVTDGRRAWRVSCLAAACGTPHLAVFEGAVPPEGIELWVVEPPAGAEAGSGPARSGQGDRAGAGAFAEVAGLAPRTPVETPFGAVAAHRLRPGDTVLTDAGPAPLRAVRLCPGARGVVLPADLLGPGQPPRDVTVGAGTWLGMEGPALQALFDQGEALVRAGDLEAVPGVHPLARADLIVLTLDRHRHGAPLLMAGGIPCLAGPPEAAALRVLARGEAQIALARSTLMPAPRLVQRLAA